MFDLVRPAFSAITTADGKVGIGIGFVLERNEFVVKKLLPGSEASNKVVPKCPGSILFDCQMSSRLLTSNFFKTTLRFRLEI